MTPMGSRSTSPRMRSNPAASRSTSAAFNVAMERQRVMARASWAGSGDVKAEAYWFPLREKYGATEFLGYDTETSEGVVQTIIRGGPEVGELRAGESSEVMLTKHRSTQSLADKSAIRVG